MSLSRNKPQKPTKDENIATIVRIIEKHWINLPYREKKLYEQVNAAIFLYTFEEVIGIVMGNSQKAYNSLKARRLQILKFEKQMARLKKTPSEKQKHSTSESETQSISLPPRQPINLYA